MLVEAMLEQSFRFCVWIFLSFGELGDEYQAREKLALIPNMMYLPRVQGKTQIKSESLQTNGGYNHGKTRESGT